MRSRKEISYCCSMQLIIFITTLLLFLHLSALFDDFLMLFPNYIHEYSFWVEWGDDLHVVNLLISSIFIQEEVYFNLITILSFVIFIVVWYQFICSLLLPLLWFILIFYQMSRLLHQFTLFIFCVFCKQSHRCSQIVHECFIFLAIAIF